MSYPINQTLFVEKNETGIRLDIFVALKFANISRSCAANFIKKGFVEIKGKSEKSGYKLKKGDEIYINVPEKADITSLKPEHLPLDIIFEDKDIVIVNKPPGMVVHPGPGNPSKTLANAVLYMCPDIKGIGAELRPGIVHRLDKDTSGIMIVAKNDYSLQELSYQFKVRKIIKKYIAIVHGVVKEDEGIIKLPIGRHKIDRKKMSVANLKNGLKHAREAVTIWKVKKRFKDFSLLDIEIKTGRTHQIRVHCLSMRHPVAGDAVYTFRKLKEKENILNIKRQMLHSEYISFIHPFLKKRVSFKAELFDDMKQAISAA
jgi:23S rRNA pseudouridine1911/1915/1917 synthase